VIESTAAVTRARIEALGSELGCELRCAHETGAVAAALAQAAEQGVELILVAGASVSKDRGDTVPAAVTAAGGEILHFGMPVEPGNMLLYARLGAVPVINLPGCARSRRLNGLDWMLHRLLARLPVSGADIAAMGVGGLIASGAEGDKEGERGPQPGARPARIAALVLAAGGSTRMRGANKLLLPVRGVPMVNRVVAAALASQCVQTMVVTGHEAEPVEAALADLPVSVVRNAASAQGMSASLRCGLRALPHDIDGVLVLLADMPLLRAEHIDALIAAFDPAAPGIVAPQRDGRRGNPVLWPRGYFAQIMDLHGDQGARSLLERSAADAVLVEVEDDAFFTDFDTPEAFETASPREGAMPPARPGP
jgi:molybdenum cofactor cytidylyltransferase